MSRCPCRCAIMPCLGLLDNPRRRALSRLPFLLLLPAGPAAEGPSAPSCPSLPPVGGDAVLVDCPASKWPGKRDAELGHPVGHGQGHVHRPMTLDLERHADRDVEQLIVLLDSQHN